MLFCAILFLVCFQITKKLAGKFAGTALWASSVSNEDGQVLNTVLTDREGQGLDKMVKGIVSRYRDADISPPCVLYVDRDCCGCSGQGKTQRQFRDWPALIVRLDIWHYMRRLARGCTTESHQLYGMFMSRLAACLFEWDSDDLSLLIVAKRNELARLGVTDLSDDSVRKRLTKNEMQLHCRRHTSGTEKTVQLLTALLQSLDGPAGRDSLGVPLLDQLRMRSIWEDQKPHVRCIQDPELVQLYTRKEVLKKGGVDLPVYRCARGSTSLESFHLHLNRFIPGMF